MICPRVVHSEIEAFGCFQKCSLSSVREFFLQNSVEAAALGGVVLLFRSCYEHDRRIDWVFEKKIRANFSAYSYSAMYLICESVRRMSFLWGVKFLNHSISSFENCFQSLKHSYSRLTFRQQHNLFISFLTFLNCVLSFLINLIIIQIIFIWLKNEKWQRWKFYFIRFVVGRTNPLVTWPCPTVYREPLKSDKGGIDEVAEPPPTNRKFPNDRHQKNT